MNKERPTLPPLTQEERDSYRMPERRDFYDEADHRYEEQRQEEADCEY